MEITKYKYIEFSGGDNVFSTYTIENLHKWDMEYEGVCKWPDVKLNSMKQVNLLPVLNYYYYYYYLLELEIKENQINVLVGLSKPE